MVRTLKACWLVLVLSCAAGPVWSHALGIDPAELTELSNQQYELVVTVPRVLSHLITAPGLPEDCELTGNPRGQRGPMEVRFEFSCVQPLNSGDSLVLPWQREGVLLTVNWANGHSSNNMMMREGGEIMVPLAVFQASSSSWMAGAQRYLVLGIEHILLGFDHLLFVLALLFIVGGGWRLVKAITAFTVAHSITLGLATLGYVSMPSAPVEAVIALSIVFLCVEIIHARQGRKGLAFRYPWVVAFAFGLLHGFGFAGALSAIGLPPAEIPLALLFFNLGVEVGQLIFVFAVLTIFALLRKIMNLTRESHAFVKLERILVYGIGVLSTYWLIERGLGSVGFGW